LETIRHVIDQDPVPPRQLNAQIPRDLETICLKALEKDRARRYESAAALGDDLERFLARKPIHARPPSVADRLVKFTRRNKVLVGGTATTMIALLAGIVTSLFFLREANAAGTVARHEAANARFTAARLFTQTGNWQRAIEDYEAAQQMGYRDDVALQLGLLVCFEATLDPRGRDLLDGLARRSDLGSHSGSVALWNARVRFAKGD